MTARRVRAGLGRGMPWLALAAALVLATMPAWRPLIFGLTLGPDDLLALRCPP